MSGCGHCSLNRKSGAATLGLFALEIQTTAQITEKDCTPLGVMIPTFTLLGEPQTLISEPRPLPLFWGYFYFYGQSVSVSCPFKNAYSPLCAFSREHWASMVSDRSVSDAQLVRTKIAGAIRYPWVRGCVVRPSRYEQVCPPNCWRRTEPIVNHVNPSPSPGRPNYRLTSVPRIQFVTGTV